MVAAKSVKQGDYDGTWQCTHGAIINNNMPRGVATDITCTRRVLLLTRCPGLRAEIVKILKNDKYDDGSLGPVLVRQVSRVRHPYQLAF